MTERPDLRVVELHSQAMAADIVGSMRRSADAIAAEAETDDRTVAGMFVQVTESGAVRAYAWGKVGSQFEGIGILHAGIEAVR